MKKIQTIVFVLILTACAQQPVAPQMTVTSKVTVTLTPTATFTVVPNFTPTPTASATPLPELPPETIAAIETQLPGYAVTGDQLINKETGKTVLDWHVVPSADSKDWSYQSTYAFGNNPEFTEVIPNELIKIAKDGTINMEGHTYNPVTGEMLQKTVSYQARGNKEILVSEIPLLSLSQDIEIIRQETQKIKNANGGIIPEGYGVGGYDMFFKYENRGLVYQGIWFREAYIGTNNELFDGSRLRVKDAESGGYVDEITLFHSWVAVGIDPRTLCTADGFKDAKGVIQVNFVDQDLNRKNVTKSGYTPFTIEN